MIESFALMAVVTVLWGWFSYSLSFGLGNSVIGGLHNLFVKGVGASPDLDYAPTIPAQTFHGLLIDGCHHYSRTDCRSVRRAHEVQRNAGVYDFAVSCRVRPDGAYGMGQGRPSECIAGRAFPGARFCGGNGRAPHLRNFSLGVRLVSRKAPGIRKSRRRRTAWC